MKCPKCHSEKTTVHRHRVRKDMSSAIERQHLCLDCGEKFPSLQRYDNTVEFRTLEEIRAAKAKRETAKKKPHPLPLPLVLADMSITVKDDWKI